MWLRGAYSKRSPQCKADMARPGIGRGAAARLRNSVQWESIDRIDRPVGEETPMRTILTTFVCIAGIAFATAVAAQGTGTGSVTSPGPATSGTAQGGGTTGAGSAAPPAPVGHRQPTAADTAR